MNYSRGCNATYKTLSHHFGTLGRQVAKFPSWFLVIPVFISLLLATGLQRLKSKMDVEYFISVDNSESYRNRNLIESLFPMDVASEFDLGRYTRIGRFAVAFIKAKDDGSLLRKDVAQEIIQLSNIIFNVSIKSHSKTLRYEDLCLPNKEQCYVNDVVPLYLKRNGNLSFKYPIEINRNYGFKFYGSWMGGVDVNGAGIATSVKTIRLMYFLDKDDAFKSPLTVQWQLKFVEDIKSTNFKFITVLPFVSKSIEYEMGDTFDRAIPYLIVASFLVTIFTISTCIVPNWIEGKPWTGVTTAIGSGLASLSGFGLISYFEIPYLYFNILIPFLVLGIGMDDTFVFLSAWRRTDRDKSIEERLGEAYSESSVAISLTSVTNIVSFAIGAIMSPFASVRVFCTLATCCLIFDYIYQITFVGACMAMFGYAEEKNRHCFTMIPVKPLKNSEGPQGCFQWILFHTGHYTLESKKTSFLLRIWDDIGNILTKTSTKIIVLLAFGIYFSIGFWSARNISSGIEIKDMAFYDSPIYRFLQESSDSFHQYLERIQVVVPIILDYSNPETNQILQKMFKAFESTDLLCNSSMTESWLRSYYEFMTDPRYAAITNSYNITDKSDFIKALRELFLRHPVAKRFKNDIAFNDNYTEIIASRFFFQTNYTVDDSTFFKMWWNFQKVARSFPVPVIVFNRFAYFSEGFSVIIPMTLQTLAVATCAVAAVSYLFLCSIRCTICITFCILSTVIGVLGYMTIWGVNINIVSMVIIMLVSGFSVDYSSHVAYAYISATGTSSEKLKKSITDVGLPIFQASGTTLLSILVFIVPPSYSFLVLLKVIFLLTFLAGTHALVFLPVFLSLLEDLFKYLSRTIERKYKTDKSGNGKHVYVNHGAADLSRTEISSIDRRNSITESIS